MARIWTAGALSRIPTQGGQIELPNIDAGANAVIVPAPGTGLLLAIMGLILYGQRSFALLDSSGRFLLAGQVVPLPDGTILTLAMTAEPWGILADNVGLEVCNCDTGAPSEFSGAVAYKVLPEQPGG